MTLGFMQQWPKDMALQENKTYFIEKIHSGLLQADLEKQIDYIEYLENYRSKFKSNWDVSELFVKPKLHTIRTDEHDRWNAGMNIHFVINGRTKNRFQFAPVMQCVSVQEIEIEYVNDWLTIRIDGRYLKLNEKLSLAQNDGFDSIEHFKKYFKKDFKGKIIHWTDLKY